MVFPGMKSQRQEIETQYRNEVGLTIYPYVADHKIFEFILVPAAVFLEIALRASTLHGMGFPIVLTNFGIQAALQLENDNLQLCTTVVYDNDGESKIGAIRSYSKQVSMEPVY